MRSLYYFSGSPGASCEIVSMRGSEAVREYEAEMQGFRAYGKNPTGQVARYVSAVSNGLSPQGLVLLRYVALLLLGSMQYIG